MKVIEKGRPQKGWAQEFVCTGFGNGKGGCQAKLLVEQDDVFYTYRSFYDGSNETYKTFQCCECGVLTDLPVGTSLPFTPRARNKKPASHPDDGK